MDKTARFRENTRKLEFELARINRGDCCCAVSSAQCFALVEIGRCPGISVKELAAILNVDKSSASRTVEELVKGAFAERRISETDRRFVSLYLTQKGLERFNSIEDSMNSIFENILGFIPEEKQEEVISSLELYIEACRKAEEGEETDDE